MRTRSRGNRCSVAPGQEPSATRYPNEVLAGIRYRTAHLQRSSATRDPHEVLAGIQRSIARRREPSAARRLTMSSQKPIPNCSPSKGPSDNCRRRRSLGLAAAALPTYNAAPYGTKLTAFCSTGLNTRQAEQESNQMTPVKWVSPSPGTLLRRRSRTLKRCRHCYSRLTRTSRGELRSVLPMIVINGALVERSFRIM